MMDSDWVQVILAVGVIAVGASQLYVYWKQARIMRDTIEATVRPYIKVAFDPESFGIRRRANETNHSLCIHFSLANTGKLPAYTRVQAGADWETRNHNFVRPYSAGSNVGSRYLFDSQNSGTLEACTRELNRGELLDIRSGDYRKFSVIVEVWYSKFTSYDSPWQVRACNVYAIAGNEQNLSIAQEGPCPPDNLPVGPSNYAN